MKQNLPSNPFGKYNITITEYAFFYWVIAFGEDLLITSKDIIGWEC